MKVSSLPAKTPDLKGWGKYTERQRKFQIYNVTQMCMCVFVCPYIYVCAPEGDFVLQYVVFCVMMNWTAFNPEAAKPQKSSELNTN